MRKSSLSTYRKSTQTELMKSNGNKPRRGSVVECETCGKLVYKMPAELRRSKKYYCSSKCSGMGKLKNEPLTCIVCGKEFYCSPSQEKDRNRKNCSKECNIAYRKKYLTGENNKLWKGGRRRTFHQEEREWREAVYIRDDYTCRECGKRGAALNAHHIKSYSQFPDERLNIDNGITLCLECHKEKHRSKRGKKNNCS